MVRCRNCGSSNEDDSLYCQDCGQPLPQRAPEEPAVEPEAPTEVVGPPVTPTFQTARAAMPAEPAVPAEPTMRAETTARAETPRTTYSTRTPSYPGTESPDLEFTAPPPAPGVTPRTAVSTIPGTLIVLSEGERLWRAYPVLHFRPFRMRAKGTLYVTDSRIILHTSAMKLTGRTALLQEVRLESVTGFGSYIDRGLGALGFLVLILFTVAGIEQLFSGSKFYGVVLLVIVGLTAFISYRYGRLGLQVFTSQASIGPINFGRFAASRLQSVFPTLSLVGGVIGGVQATDVLYCFPEANANEVITELGALVFDLNRKGTLEGSQWET